MKSVLTGTSRNGGLPQNINFGSSNQPCDPSTIKAIVEGAVNNQCDVTYEDVKDSITPSLRKAMPYSKKKKMSQSIADFFVFPIIQAITNIGLFTEGALVGVQHSVLNWISADVAFPSENDITRPVLAAVTGASAGTGKVGHIITADAVDIASQDGYTYAAPILGYLLKINWTAADVSSELRFIDNAGSAVVHTLTPNDGDCKEAYAFLNTHGGTPTLNNGRVVFPYSGGRQVNFNVYTGGAAATALGGWTIKQQPVYMTQELIEQITPACKGNHFSRP